MITADALLRNKDIDLALSLPVSPATWPEDDDAPSFIDAEQPARIGRILIKEAHQHLVNAKIGYLYREKMSEHDKTKLAKASRVGAKLRHFSDLDFIVEVNHEAWLKLEDHQKVALIDHELHHFGVGDEGGYTMVSHDLEEFNAIVRRWGLWMPDVRDFGRAMADQGELFELVKDDSTKITISGTGIDKPIETTSRGLEEAAEALSGKKRR